MIAFPSEREHDEYLARQWAAGKFASHFWAIGLARKELQENFMDGVPLKDSIEGLYAALADEIGRSLAMRIRLAWVNCSSLSRRICEEHSWQR